ncbi:MAG: aldo/keto reductase [Actinomycetes bacterium]
MALSQLGKTDLRVHQLCLGGNVFGWSANTAESHDVLNRYADNGGNFIDTADMYSEWKDGNVGGESETIIGEWMRSRSNRNDVVIATKVGQSSRRPGLSAHNIHQSIDESLQRLGTDYVDIYYAHFDDLETPLTETLSAFHDLVVAGKVRYLGASNYTGERLAEALKISRELGISEYVVVQPLFNVIERSEYEGALQNLCVAENIACLPYYSVARGLLTGKYTRALGVESVRLEDIEETVDERSWSIVDAVSALAATHSVSMSAVALAWSRAQAAVGSPIASARIASQLPDLMQDVELTQSELKALSAL